MEKSPKDFFISYNYADMHWAIWIHEQLEKAGYTTIIQVRDFLPGENFLLGMHEAAMVSKRTIAVLSEDYLKARFTSQEWAAAMVEDPTGEKGKLVPVRVRPCEPPGLLKSVIHIDLVGLDENEARERLIAGVAPGRAPLRTPVFFPGNTSSANVKSGKPASAPSSSTDPKPEVFPKGLSPVTKTIETFIVYSQADVKYLANLEKELLRLNRKGLIKTWNSSQMVPGSVVKDEFERHWNRSQIILLLVSADLMHDSYKIIERAIARHEEKSAKIIPILVRPCISELEETFVVLPEGDKAISQWENRDEAYVSISRGIEAAAKELLFKEPV